MVTVKKSAIEENIKLRCHFKLVTTFFYHIMFFVVVGDTHKILVELEGMGGGGMVWLEVCFFQWKRIKTNQQYKFLIWEKIIGICILVNIIMSMPFVLQIHFSKTKS